VEKRYAGVTAALVTSYAGSGNYVYVLWL